MLNLYVFNILFTSLLSFNIHACIHTCIHTHNVTIQMTIFSVICLKKVLRISNTTRPATKVITVQLTANYEGNFWNLLRK